jgi:hypothetical protein
VPSQIDEDAKAMIAAYMSHKRGSYEAFEALVDQAKAEPEEYTTSLVCLAIEMLNRLSNLARNIPHLSCWWKRSV